MSVSLEPQGGLRAFSRWGLDSGGLRALSVLVTAFLMASIAHAVAYGFGVRIDVGALGVTFCALEVGLFRGLALTLGVGYIADVASGQPRGLWTFGAVVGYAVLRLFVVRVVGARAPTVVFLTVVAASAAMVGRAVLQLATEVAPTGAMSRALVTLVATAVVGYPAYWMFRFASDRFRPRDETLFR